MSNKIICPHCGKEFEIDSQQYDSIAKQVRDEEFAQELHKQKETMRKEREDAVKIAVLDTENKMRDSVEKANKKADELKHELELETVKKDKEIARINDSWKEKLKESEEQVQYYKDLKSRMSTKMVGETLEQHCETEFNRIRMAAFPNAYFEKDNEVSKESGSKGDFIFRDYTEDGTEFISIMFEMKSEMETTEKKHKNEYFFKELDKDRREKGCEYAVLVTMLEADSELYNQGIVDVSYRYPKMYVIRPQFFIPMISLLRNAALNSVQYQNALAVERSKNIDLVQFENELDDFKKKFSRNYDLASRKFQDAIDDIDKTIAQLQRVRDDLTGSNRNLSLAYDKLERVSTEKLVKNSPSLKEELEKKKGKKVK